MDVAKRNGRRVGEQTADLKPPAILATTPEIEAATILHWPPDYKGMERVRMHRSMIPLLAASLVTIGCAASLPPPTQSLADAQSAERSAAELGAATQPKAQLHLQLAREQIAQATTAMKDGDNGRADALLLRARSDAELAIALTRDQGAKTDAQKAVDQSNTQKATNANQGAAQ
jgi:hypothetical protein